MQITTNMLDTLKAAGYDEASLNRVSHYEATQGEVEKLLGYNPGGSGLVFVYQDLNGDPVTLADGKNFVRVKINRTAAQVAEWEKTTGKKSGKYACPKNSGCHFYFSQIQPDWKAIAEKPSVPIFITEGEKKGDIMNQAGYPTIALGGVYSWKQKGQYTEESTPIKDFDLIVWRGRTVYLTPDSDVNFTNKPMIKAAMKELAEHLESLGANVFIIVLPHTLNGEKMGSDDFINSYGKDAFEDFVKVAPKALVKAGKSPKSGMVLNLEPPNPYRQAEIISILLSTDYAYREDIGWYNYQPSQGYWKCVGVTSMRKIFVKVYNIQGWSIDNSGAASYIEKVLPALSMVDEDKWNSPGFMLFNNGLYNPLLNKFLPHFSRTLYITHQPLSFPYVEHAETPHIFLKYLNEATGGDTKTVELIQAILKYVWLPKNKTQRFELEYAFDFYGGKGTGKSTLIDVLIRGLGQDNVADAAPSVFATPESVSQLIDKKAAISPDTLGFVANPDILNKVISNEQLTVRKLYQNPVFIRLGVVVVRAYNKILSMGAGSDGQDRRLVVIEFNNKPKTVDIELSNKLAGEMSQIINWAFSLPTSQMIQRIRTRNGSALADRASAERFAENNPVFQYLEDKYPEGSAGVKINEFYAEYVAWCDMQHMKPLQQRNFKHAATVLGCALVLNDKGQPVKPQGYFKYTVPKMSDFNMRKHLGYEDEEPIEEISTDEPTVDTQTSEPLQATAKPKKPVIIEPTGSPVSIPEYQPYKIPDRIEVESDADIFQDYRYMDE